VSAQTKVLAWAMSLRSQMAKSRAEWRVMAHSTYLPEYHAARAAIRSCNRIIARSDKAIAEIRHPRIK
jgi:hypothetical protein